MELEDVDEVVEDDVEDEYPPDELAEVVEDVLLVELEE